MIRKGGFMKYRIHLILFALFLTVFSVIPAHCQMKPEIMKAADITGKKGGTLILALMSDPRTFNPLYSSSDQASSMVTNMLFDGLTQINLKTQEIIPALASNWSVSKDGKEWIFHIRKGAQWSDGHPITADDVIFTLETIYNPKIETPSKDILQFNQQPLKAQKIDNYTIKINLPSIYAPFLRQMEKSTLPILPKHKWEQEVKAGTFATAMGLNYDPKDIIVSGPYMLEKYIPGQRVILKANPNYYRYDKNNTRLPYFDKIVINIITDLNTIYYKLLSGELHLWESLRPEEYSMLKEKSNSAQLKVEILGISPGPEMLWFNLDNELNPKTKLPFMETKKIKWFNNLLFRKAIAFGIDRETIIRNVYYGTAKPAFGVENESNKIWYNSGIATYSYDPKKAKELLKQAGFTLKQETPNKSVLYDSDRNEVKFTLITNSKHAARASAVNFIASDLKKLGMKVNVQLMEFQNLVVKLTETFDYDMVLFAFTRPDLDPSSTMNFLVSSSGMHVWHPNEKQPASPWEARLDELMNLQLSTYDVAARKKYYDETQKIINEQLPVIYLYSPLAIAVYKNNIANLKCTIIEPRCIWNIEELSLK